MAKKSRQKKGRGIHKGRLFTKEPKYCAAYTIIHMRIEFSESFTTTVYDWWKPRLLNSADQRHRERGTVSWLKVEGKLLFSTFQRNYLNHEIWRMNSKQHKFILEIWIQSFSTNPPKFCNSLCSETRSILGYTQYSSRYIEHGLKVWHQVIITIILIYVGAFLIKKSLFLV